MSIFHASVGHANTFSEIRDSWVLAYFEVCKRSRWNMNQLTVVPMHPDLVSTCPLLLPVVVNFFTQVYIVCWNEFKDIIELNLF